MENIFSKDIKNAPLEIERKYLIKMPDINILMGMPSYSCVHIEQTYILVDGEKGRIRKVSQNGNVKYIFTQKEKISDISRYEYEKEIEEDEYKRLLMYKHKDSTTIEKDRHSFVFNNQKYEVDIYSFWEDVATVEAETDSENAKISIPPCLDLIKEVTFDKRYRNFALAFNHKTEKI